MHNDDDKTIRYWLINEWGGIHSFKRTLNNDEKIAKFEQQIYRGRLTNQTFTVISSLSKVASFLDSENFVIYDSRVIYALNWLLFKYTNATHFFPQPVSRNATLSQYDLRTIFALSKRNVSLIDNQIAYHEFCALIRSIAGELDLANTPFLIEMLLFALAPTYIINDIQTSISLTVQND